MTVNQERDRIVSVHRLNKLESFATKANLLQFSKQCRAPNRVVSLDFDIIIQIIIISIKHYFRYVNEGSCKRSPFPPCLAKKCWEHKYRIQSTTTSPEPELLWTKNAISLDRLSHVFAHSDSQKTQNIAWNCERTVIGGLTRVTSLNIKSLIPLHC